MVHFLLEKKKHHQTSKLRPKASWKKLEHPEKIQADMGKISKLHTGSAPGAARIPPPIHQH